ncbi:phage holin family protein [Gordonia zhaorongruii]|uniref:phage holin family protein n=1 Tax=Gordonia zhaorongruii TaxID=2597659 RepID=UPI001043CFA9|nr:phage holin family protein [Gordonia zhaorongruii]
MRAFLIRSAFTGLGLWIATLIVPGVDFDFGDLTSWWEKLGVVLLVAILFGLINGIIKPIVQVLAIPLYVVTLGLIHIVINALMLRITSWCTDNVFPVGLQVDDIFWSGVFGAIVISIVGWLTALLMKDRLENMYR